MAESRPGAQEAIHACQQGWLKVRTPRNRALTSLRLHCKFHQSAAIHTASIGLGQDKNMAGLKFPQTTENFRRKRNHMNQALASRRSLACSRKATACWRETVGNCSKKSSKDSPPSR